MLSVIPYCCQNGIENQNDKVSVWAHMFGCLAGVMFGRVLLKDSREEVSTTDNVSNVGFHIYNLKNHIISCRCAPHGQKQKIFVVYICRNHMNLSKCTKLCFKIRNGKREQKESAALSS